MKMIVGLLAVGLLGAAPAQSAVVTYDGGGGLIQDYTNTVSTIDIGDAFNILDVNVAVDGLTHSFPRDVQFFLEHQNQSVRLIFNNGPGRDGSFGSSGLGFDDEASESIRDYNSGTFGPYRPIDALALFDGQAAQGAWSLRAYDAAGGDNGSFSGWRLQLENGVTQAVPEPATWAMMVGGFGLVGGMLRRGRQTGRVRTDVAFS